MLYGIPHVLTAHSLEPMRPWKAEQLGGGYRISSWVEKTAVEAADAVIADLLQHAGDRSVIMVTHHGVGLDRMDRTITIAREGASRGQECIPR